MAERPLPVAEVRVHESDERGHDLGAATASQPKPTSSRLKTAISMIVLIAPTVRNRVPSATSRFARGGSDMIRLRYRDCLSIQATSDLARGDRDVSFEHIAVVMPAYNEADGIAEFLAEIHEHVAPLTARLDIIVADDRSTDATAAVMAGLDCGARAGAYAGAQPRTRPDGARRLSCRPRDWRRCHRARRR